MEIAGPENNITVSRTTTIKSAINFVYRLLLKSPPFPIKNKGTTEIPKKTTDDWIRFSVAHPTSEPKNITVLVSNNYNISHEPNNRYTHSTLCTNCKHNSSYSQLKNWRIWPRRISNEWKRQEKYEASKTRWTSGTGVPNLERPGALAYRPGPLTHGRKTNIYKPKNKAEQTRIRSKCFAACEQTDGQITGTIKTFCMFNLIVCQCL